MAAITICSDFGAEEEICHYFHLFPLYLRGSNGAKCYDLSFFFFFLYVVLSWLFHSPPSPTSEGFLVPLPFLPLECYHPHTWGGCCFSHPSWFQLGTHPAQHFSCALSVQVKQTGWKKSSLWYSFLDLEPISCSIRSPNYCFLIHTQVSQETGKMVWHSISLRAFHSLSWSTQSKALA